MKTIDYRKLLSTINFLILNGRIDDAVDELKSLYRYGYHDGVNEDWWRQQENEKTRKDSVQ